VRSSNNANGEWQRGKQNMSTVLWQLWRNFASCDLFGGQVPNLPHIPRSILAAEEFHDIVPPVGYSLVSPWLIFAIAFVVLSLLGFVIWWFARRRKQPLPPKLPRQIALEELERIRDEIERVGAYEFSIRVSDILRRYVTRQYGLPATRQTSIEFLTALANASPFSADEKSLLEDFLNRCDLIKFARYEATSADSNLLLDEAIHFVKGARLATV
jgi:hypothetical protein